MRFYVCTSKEGVTIDCVKSFDEAKIIVSNQGGGTVTGMSININPDSIRRILGNIGGYAKNITHCEVTK